MLTPCTIGNGWLKIFDFGRYALALYEKYGGQGIRVFLDIEKDISVQRSGRSLI